MKIKYVMTAIGFIIGFTFGSSIGIAGGFGAINGAWIVALIGGYLGWTLAPSVQKNRTNFAQSEIERDVEFTLLRTYEKLQSASLDPELLTRSMSMGAALAACAGAVRDAYNLPVEDDGIAMKLLVASEKADYDLVESIDQRIMHDLKKIPNLASADKLKTSYIIHLLAPSVLA